MRQLLGCRLVALILGIVLLAIPGSAIPAQQPGSNLRISVITIGPGAQVWERFGHNAIMLENTRTGQAVWYNYGMFDFGAKDFWPRFMKGDMRYWMQGGQVRLELPFYFQSNRTVWAQELDLEPAPETTPSEAAQAESIASTPIVVPESMSEGTTRKIIRKRKTEE